MIQTTFDITIIGAGVVGLAIAEELSGQYGNVLLLEKNPSYGMETSSRHSEVIHAGIYYPAGFLKAELCREGNRLLYEICEQRDIPHRKTGKLIVAADDTEVAELSKIRDRAEMNGIDDLSFVSQKQLLAMEPEVRAHEALFSPSTGIIDTHALMQSFFIKAQSDGAMIVFHSEVTEIHPSGGTYEIQVNQGEYRFRTRVIINCAGLHADRVASSAGIDIDKKDYRLKYCKGDYFSASPSPKLSHLVYPVPQEEQVGLGVHATLDLAGRVRFGPDTEYVTELEYTVDEEKGDAFWQSVRRYLPGVRRQHLHPDTSGIRPKLQGPGDPYRDFVITEESTAGYPGLINLIGIESPGLTSCIPIARYVSRLVKSYLN
ncbi:MAG: NAD(P)/FAD-dependent oxidoreductase [Syntrophales bacterium]|nr:NAD(P)/FAD-dependent oxidoreductase [Syntrophales bacterium]